MISEIFPDSKQINVHYAVVASCLPVDTLVGVPDVPHLQNGPLPFSPPTPKPVYKTDHLCTYPNPVILSYNHFNRPANNVHLHSTVLQTIATYSSISIFK
jgi:hypothetical protein